MTARFLFALGFCFWQTLGTALAEGRRGLYVIDDTGLNCSSRSVMSYVALLAGASDPQLVVRYYQGIRGNVDGYKASNLAEIIASQIERDYLIQGSSPVTEVYIAGAGTGAIIASEVIKLAKYKGVGIESEECQSGAGICARFRWLGLLDAIETGVWWWDYRSALPTESRNAAMDSLQPLLARDRETADEPYLNTVHVHKHPKSCCKVDPYTQLETGFHYRRADATTTIKAPATRPGFVDIRPIPMVPHERLVRFVDLLDPDILGDNAKANLALNYLIQHGRSSGLSFGTETDIKALDQLQIQQICNQYNIKLDFDAEIDLEVLP